MGHDSKNSEGDIQVPNCLGRFLDVPIMIETVRFGWWYVGTKKMERETSQAKYSC